VRGFALMWDMYNAALPPACAETWRPAQTGMTSCQVQREGTADGQAWGEDRAAACAPASVCYKVEHAVERRLAAGWFYAMGKEARSCRV